MPSSRCFEAPHDSQLELLLSLAKVVLSRLVILASQTVDLLHLIATSAWQCLRAVAVTLPRSLLLAGLSAKVTPSSALLSLLLAGLSLPRPASLLTHGDVQFAKNSLFPFPSLKHQRSSEALCSPRMLVSSYMPLLPHISLFSPLSLLPLHSPFPRTPAAPRRGPPSSPAHAVWGCSRLCQTVCWRAAVPPGHL